VVHFPAYCLRGLWFVCSGDGRRHFWSSDGDKVTRATRRTRRRLQGSLVGFSNCPANWGMLSIRSWAD
jgi:hypothetical protein